ncbi:MAG: KUP/HAK/KT family potassium transporter [Chloroflexota bacterium]
MSLNFWPRVKIKYPSHLKGQIYVPVICFALFVCCVLVILYFKTSSALEAAYGLAITITMLATSILILSYLQIKKRPLILIILFALTYFSIEGAFLMSNLNKFTHGGWFTVAIAAILSLIMVNMYYGRKVRNRFISFVKLDKYLPILADMSEDLTIPKLSENLVYTTHADLSTDIEGKTIDSIIMRNPPKRADHYWFLHVDILDEPYMLEYKITDLVEGKVTRIDFYLGFKVPTRINDYFKHILMTLASEGKIDPLSTNPSLRKHDIKSSFTFLHIDRSVYKYMDLPYFDGLALKLYYRLKKLGVADIKAYGLDSNQVIIEHIPLTIPVSELKVPPIKPLTDQSKIRLWSGAVWH